ncbi:MAG: hypothetical protein F4039_04495 [Gammaproteobacteria bacterium]|nr:hypothetical protein [Gammaproteobacteria bacterium]MYF53298.1 hypothetical protein [Gammaproteobacteria bacterium]MYK43330.1 hypothetical protein [Gammaproteobacteria bacterium]
MRDDLFHVLEMVPKIASESVREQVAHAMLANHEQFGDFLTADHIKFLQQFLDEDEESNDSNSN